MGGLCEDPEKAGMDNLRLGCVIIGGEAPYQVNAQGNWGAGLYQFTEGPLLKLDSGLYAYMGNVSLGEICGMAATLWSWDSGDSTITREDEVLYNNDTEGEFEDYSQISVFAAVYGQDLVDDRLILMMGARDGDGHPCILIAHQVVFPGSMTFGGFGIDEVLPVVPESGYTVEAGGFVFTDRDPVQGIGSGLALGASDQKIWLFEIVDERRDPRALSSFMRLKRRLRSNPAFGRFHRR
ncbi:hypothetical protein GX411_04310 [Candidatus Fermentibacteria bacterium]|nr:hypothetical protein [Candidatus Fermentibacteria bacterium]